MDDPEYRIQLGAATAPTVAAYMADYESTLAAIMGPLGSGKTVGSVQKLFDWACTQEPDKDGIRPTRFGAIRNAYPDLMDTTIPDFLELWEPFGKFNAGSNKRPRFKARFQLDDGTTVESETIFIALDVLKDIRKMRGFQLTGGWFNELKELAKGAVDITMGRGDRYPKKTRVEPTHPNWIGDLNAPDRDNWVYKHFIEEPAEGWTLYVQPPGVIEDGRDDLGRMQWKVNPNAENLPLVGERYYRRQIAGKSERWIRVNLANEFGSVSDGRRVHPSFRDWQHLSDRLAYDPKQPILIGVDFGLTPAAAIGQYNSFLGRLVILDELVTQGMAALEFGKLLVQYLGTEYTNDEDMLEVFCDPAGSGRGQETGETAIGILEGCGLPAEPAPTNDFDLRCASLDSMLDELSPIDGLPRILFHKENCQRLAAGLGDTYCFKRVSVAGTEKFRDKPDKTSDSHVCEALQYLCLGIGEGARVLTPPEREEDGERQMVADGY